MLKLLPIVLATTVFVGATDTLDGADLPNVVIGSLGDNFGAIAFDDLGTLYGLTGNSSPTPHALYTINLFNRYI